VNAPLTTFSFHKFGKGEISQFPAWNCLAQFVHMVLSAFMRVALKRRKHGVERDHLMLNPHPSAHPPLAIWLFQPDPAVILDGRSECELECF